MRRTHRDNTISSSVEPVTGLAAEQRETLAKIYRLLLSLKKRGAQSNDVLQPQSPVEGSHQQERQKLIIEPLED